jgi:dTDP-4-dehydrorhamnose 3,5-epimerase
MDLAPTQLNCGAVLYPTKVIAHPKGDILHGVKASDTGFVGFGEVYFSHILPGETKGWKKHTRMTMNLLVPIGEIEFYLQKEGQEIVESVVLGESNYQRLWVPPGIWMAFKGMGQSINLLMNLASIEHDPAESETKEFVV